MFFTILGILSALYLSLSAFLFWVAIRTEMFEHLKGIKISPLKFLDLLLTMPLLYVEGWCHKVLQDTKEKEEKD